MQNLEDQVQNKEQSIAQLDAKIEALKGIQRALIFLRAFLMTIVRLKTTKTTIKWA